jgi:branched-chain amino acid aminotransferase
MGGAIVWIGGSSEAAIDPQDRGFLLGDGVFDTLVALAGTPFMGDRHLARLQAHAAAIGIAFDIDAIRNGWSDVLSRRTTEHVIIRTTVTRGRAERGLWPRGRPEPTIVVSAAPWNPSLLRPHVDLVVSAIRRNDQSPGARMKTLGYLDHVLAAREAAERGADDALFLNHAGRVACSTIANVFAIEGRSLLTPPVTDGVLDGIMRGLVTEAAPDCGLDPLERSLDLDELLGADAVFLTNSVRFLMPLRTLDGHVLRPAEDSTVHALQDAIFARVRQECGLHLPWPDTGSEAPAMDVR